MEEKLSEHMTADKIEMAQEYGQKRANRPGKKFHSSGSSIINKYISAAYERQQRTNLLAQPILDQKRNHSLNSHQSLRISTQPSECLSHRSRRIGPSSTSTVTSYISQQKKEAGARVSNKRADRNPQHRNHLQTETSQGEQQIEIVPRAIRRLQRSNGSKTSSV